ncbi:unnamed protein product [Lasius platythorax]|uniref:Uncharacterized protein n=1 Tax=Lasius platythorax TaxID=488582 RepID=A0AAV2NUZ7_9HYME
MRLVHIYSDPGAGPPIELKRTALAATTIKSQDCKQVQRPRTLFVDRDFKKFAAPGSKVDCAKHVYVKSWRKSTTAHTSEQVSRQVPVRSSARTDSSS